MTPFTNHIGTIDITTGTITPPSGGGGGTDTPVTPPADGETVTFTTVTGTYMTATGETANSANWNTTDYIAVYPNSKYTYYGTTALGDITIPSVYAYDSNKNPIQAIITNIDGTSGYIFKTTSDTAYIKLCSHKSVTL